MKGYFNLRDIRAANKSYARYRIPGMIVTASGTLIVYNEARRDPSDWAMMNIVAIRSTDSGKSFGQEAVLARGTAEHPTVNNPVMMQDKSGRIHLLYCLDYSVEGGGVFRRYSDDDGISWSEPVDITRFTMPDYRNCFALGPGHGICLNNGTMLVPVWMVPKSFGADIRHHGPSVISTLYSTDRGESWSIGDILRDAPGLVSPNETVAAELSDGRVYLNCRLGGGLGCRGQAISNDGHSDWYDYRPVHELTDPGCFGSVFSYNDGDNPNTLIFANCESKTDRKKVVVKGSTDGGKSWSLCRVIDTERGGYVEVAADNVNRHIYVLYENRAGETCSLAVFDYEWLSAGDADESSVR